MRHVLPAEYVAHGAGCGIVVGVGSKPEVVAVTSYDATDELISVSNRGKKRKPEVVLLTSPKVASDSWGCCGCCCCRY